MVQNNTMIRDFVYLDWERVRSFAAQLFRGVPEEAMAGEGSDVTVEGRLEGSIPALLKGQAGVDYRYFRTQDETRSFHHYVYTLVEDRLIKDGRVTKIDAGFDFNRWTNGFFNDGQFVLVKGAVRFMDYEWMSSTLEALPKMLGTVQRMETLALKQKKDTGPISETQLQVRKKEQKSQRTQLEELRIEELTGLIRQLYGDVIRVKLLPSRQHPDKLFVGTGNKADFHDTAASLSQKYGYEIDAGWMTLGQVNLSTGPEKPLPIPIGNQMEDAFEQLALIINQLYRTASSPQFPAVSFTPIAIYRTS